MLKNIIILIILAVVIYAFSYFYKQSKLDLTPNMVTIKVEMQDVNISYDDIKENILKFSNVEIKQYSLKHNNEKLFFEVAIIDGLYEFNYNPKEIIDKLFNVKKRNLVFSKNGLEALQLTLSDNQRVNMFMLQIDNKELRLFYGLSDELFSKVVEKLVGQKVKPIDASKLTKPISLWSTKVNDIDGLISSIDY